MKKACQFGPHDPCESCGEPVINRTNHDHRWYAARGTAGTLCEACSATIAIAAFPVLKALQGYGWAPTSRELSAAIKEGRVGVLLQLDLPSEPQRSN